MYAESKVTSSMVHVIHTDSSTIVLPDMAEFTCCTHALIVESKRLASCGTVAMVSMSFDISTISDVTLLSAYIQR